VSLTPGPVRRKVLRLSEREKEQLSSGSLIEKKKTQRGKDQDHLTPLETLNVSSAKGRGRAVLGEAGKRESSRNFTTEVGEGLPISGVVYTSP